MPTSPRPLPPTLGTVFTVAEARTAGVTRARTRSSDMTAPFAGVRVPRRAADDEADADESPGARDRAERARVLALVEAYEPLLARHAFVAGRSALVCRGVAIEHGDDVEIGVCSPDRAPRSRGVRGRKLAPHLVHTELLAGVRTASPASAWAMLGGELSVRELVRIGDQLVRIPRDEYVQHRAELQIATLDQLARVLEAGRRPGLPRLREAAQLVRVGSMSPLETDARLVLIAAGLPEPALDVEIRSESGRLLGVADALYGAERVILEIEGDHHRTSRAQWARDLQKHADYAAAGFAVVRLAGSHIRGAHPVAPAMVRAALRGPHP